MPKKHSQSNKTRKRKGKDLDEITEDLQPAKAIKLIQQPIDLDIPGCAQHYCITCVRYFTDDKTLQIHRKTKGHKQRLKALTATPFTQAESDAAAGLGTYQRPKRQKTERNEVTTQPDQMMTG